MKLNQKDIALRTVLYAGKRPVENVIDLLVNAKCLRHNTHIAERRRTECAPTKATLLYFKAQHPALIYKIRIHYQCLNPFSLGEECQNKMNLAIDLSGERPREDVSWKSRVSSVVIAVCLGATLDPSFSATKLTDFDGYSQNTNMMRRRHCSTNESICFHPRRLK